MRWTSRPCLVLASVVALAGCGGDAGDVDTPLTAPGLADAVRIDAGVDVALDEADFTAVDDPVPVTVGDLVRTDATGFAEVAYFDGSVARLDVDTTMEVVALVDDPAESEIRTRMEVGRTWHRVVDGLVGREYVVETRVATAAVRGTTFMVDCPTADSCTFTLLEGTLEIVPTDGEPVTLLAPEAAPEAATVTADGVERGVDPDVSGDPWAQRNLALDGTPGPSDGGDGGDGSGLDADPSVFAGTFAVATADLDVTSDTCTITEVDATEDFVTALTPGCETGSWGFPLPAGTAEVTCTAFDCSTETTSRVIFSIVTAADGFASSLGGGPCGGESTFGSPIEVVATEEATGAVTAWTFDVVSTVGLADDAECVEYRYSVTLTRTGGVGTSPGGG